MLEDLLDRVAAGTHAARDFLERVGWETLSLPKSHHRARVLTSMAQVAIRLLETAELAEQVREIQEQLKALNITGPRRIA